MSPRVTQNDVARAAGVHNTTVSLALRNSQLLPAATRERIQALARSMGYRPDPALRALIAYRDSRRDRRSADILAYVTNWESKWGWRDLPSHAAHYRAAQRKAAELGYYCEHLWLGEPGMTQRRLDCVLLHRNVRGVLFAASRATTVELTELDWRRLGGVRIGAFPHLPTLHQIADDPAGVVQLAMRHILFAGYRRIGLVMSHRWDRLTDEVWSAAFHAEQHRCRLRDRLPVLHLRSPLEDQPDLVSSPHDFANDASALLHWTRQYRPDAVMGMTPAVLAHLRRCGSLVPGDFGYVDLLLQEPAGKVAGVWTDCERMGELAIEMLADQLQRNQLGVPQASTVTTIGGVWRDGESLPTRVAPAAPAWQPAVGA